jgi:hypothetical protein
MCCKKGSDAIEIRLFCFVSGCLFLTYIPEILHNHRITQYMFLSLTPSLHSRTQSRSIPGTRFSLYLACRSQLFPSVQGCLFSVSHSGDYTLKGRNLFQRFPSKFQIFFYVNLTTGNLYSVYIPSWGGLASFDLCTR